MCNLNELTKRHIEDAIKKYQALEYDGKLNPRRKSKDYNLILENNFFPPKYIVAIACDIKNNIEISYNNKYEFIAHEAIKTLEKLGFIIKKEDKNMQDTISEAIESFINTLEENNEDISDFGIEMETPKRKDIFYVFKDKKKNIIVKPLNGTAQFSISIPAIKRYMQRREPTHPVYIQPIGEYIIERYIKDISVQSNIKPSSSSEPLENRVKNIILYGSPGVGKTYSHKKLIALIEGNDFKENEIFDFIINNKDDEIIVGSVEELFEKVQLEQRMKFITFHQSFGYEDFIEGFRPNEDGDIKLQDGIFKSICNDANNDRGNKYYLVIDEINRGNISKIFGELITLIEEDKRDTLEVTLPYSKKPFKIPSNLYIIGTMNSTDKSIALIDIALRRRFTFLKMKPNIDLVSHIKAKNIMQILNEKITETLGSDYVLGHSYFMQIKNDDNLAFVLEYKIKPLLEEYFYGDKDAFDEAKRIISEYI